jgi:hypothetical protein
MSIEEGNKLIAEFMGLKSEWKKYPNPQLDRLEVDKGTHWDEAKYHTSWDWLMPVAAKVTAMNLPNSAALYIAPVSLALVRCNINDTWQSVVAFITWYNQQPKQT